MDHYKNSYKVTDKKLVSLSVNNVGYQKCNSLYQWGPGIRDHYIIHYIVSGKGHYRFGHDTVELCAGDAFLVYPHTEVTYYADKENAWEYAWVGFTGSDAATILASTDFSNKTPYIKQISNGPKIHSQLLRIYDARGNEFHHAVEMAGQLYTTLALFMKTTPQKRMQDSANSYVQKAVEYITSNFSYAITVEDIADYVGVSRSHLFRSFESVLGISPKKFLTEFRLKQACYLLEYSSLSITSIASSVGFDNNLYFSKTFHKEKGVSPKVYRDQRYKKS